jgi:hypothetical protein
MPIESPWLYGFLVLLRSVILRPETVITPHGGYPETKNEMT